MMMAPGTLPGMLAQEELVAAMRLLPNDDAAIEKLYSIFGQPIVTEPDALELEIYEEVRRVVGSFASSPQVADRISGGIASKIRMTAMYLDHGFVLKDEDLRDLRIVVGEDSPRVLMSAQERARDRDMANTMTIAKTHLRTWVNYLYTMLSSLNITYTLDGVANTDVNPFGIGLTAAVASWALATTDIVADMDLFHETFERDSDGPVTDILVHPAFFRTYLSGNNRMQDFLLSNTAFAGIGNTPIGALLGAGASEGRTFNVHKMTLRPETAPGTGAYSWPANIMTFIHNPGATCRQWTVRAQQNEYNGGPFTYLVEKANPKSVERVVHFNGAAGFLRPHNVRLFQVAP